MLNRLFSNILPLMPRQLVWLFSKQYIAGETIDDAVQAARTLKEQNCMSTIDLLGEFITDLDQARKNKEAYLRLISAAKTGGIDGNYSLKPTFFGLLLDKKTAFAHVREIVETAANLNHFVRIDMEDSACTDLEIELFRDLHADFPGNVGLVLQAYLRRTLSDIEALSDLNQADIPLNLRICKGIYVEPEKIAYQTYEQINENYLKCIDLMLQKKIYPAVATHDKVLVKGVTRLLREYQIPENKYEFQMLYGVTPGLRQAIVNSGHRMRIYIPFGREWFGYCTRRIKENPKIGSMVVKALFRKG